MFFCISQPFLFVRSKGSISTLRAVKIKLSTYFSMCAFSIRVPPIIAITKPNITYKMATFAPNILISRTREPRSTIGEEIKNEKVTPSGKPADVKPINNGMDEQEQKGVTVPSKAATELAPMPWYRPNIFLLRSGGK